MTRAAPTAPLAATRPPEADGLARDLVRLLVARTGRPLRHTRFRDLPDALRPGDLVVVNTSATEPAAVDGHRPDGRAVAVHVSGPDPGPDPGTRSAPDGTAGWVVELRGPDDQRVLDATAGERLRLPDGVHAVLRTGYPDRDRTAGGRLWTAQLHPPVDLPDWLRTAGRPIRYPYLDGHWPLADHTTALARPDGGFGSAEMPSAARPFTAAVLAGLRARAIGVAEVVLHTGVSSLEAGESPLPERYAVPAATAHAVAATRAAGGRVVAVGTTVTRALEAVADRDGRLHPGSGWTDLVLGPDRPARVVTGLVTGWHEAQASHLLLLEAVAGRPLVDRAYAAAAHRGYRWHEFGDSCLLLPGGVVGGPARRGR